MDLPKDRLPEHFMHLVDAAIVQDWQEDFRSEAGGSGSYRTLFVWRLGNSSGHEPTREQARAAVLRAANISPG